MKLIANGINNSYLKSCLPNATEHDVDGVLAAIAYGSDQQTLLKNCLDNKWNLDIWMRYDHTVPVSPALLSALLKNMKNNVFCFLVPDVLHAKVIWWRGYGAYIGSANLTDRAWYSNIEAGLFMTEDELNRSNMLNQLEQFFDNLRTTEAVVPLSQGIIDEQTAIAKLKENPHYKYQEEQAKKKRSLPVFEGLKSVDIMRGKDRRKETFRKEWSSAMSYIDHIASQINDFRPSWIGRDIPVYWQVDQMLHAYYYNKVHQRESNTYPFEEFYSRNKKDPGSALHAVFLWWQSLPDAPSGETDNLYHSAPRLKALLSKEKLLTLTESELEEVCRYTHATKDHVIKMSTASLGRPDVKTLTRDERLPLFAHWLYQQRNAKGQDIRQVLFEILYTGKQSDIWERIYHASKTDDLYIPHYGLNSIAEVIGWARPELTPPRNGRTNKALRALGYDIKVNP